MSLMGFRISRVTHCIAGRSNLERTPCAFEVQGILWLWKTWPFPRGTRGQTALVDGIMYCTRYCLRTALRAAASLQRYVKTPRRAPVRDSGNYNPIRLLLSAPSRADSRWLLPANLTVRHTAAWGTITDSELCLQFQKSFTFYCREITLQVFGNTSFSDVSLRNCTVFHLVLILLFPWNGRRLLLCCSLRFLCRLTFFFPYPVGFC